MDYPTPVQKHGFLWEHELICNVYGAMKEELQSLNYIGKADLPSKFNRLDNCDLSIKVSGRLNSVCMADCLRIYDAVDGQLHMTVIHYKQNGMKKTIINIIEIDLTSSREILFGTITRSQIEELDKAIKSIPQKRKPTPDEHKQLYSMRDKLQSQSKSIHFDIKCNSTQSRLQCSFNKFQTFIKENSERIVAQSSTNEFRNGKISLEIISPCRVFNK